MVTFFVVGVVIGSSMLGDTKVSDENRAEKAELKKELQDIKTKLADMDVTNEELLLRLDDNDHPTGPVINLDDIHVGADEYQPPVLNPPVKPVMQNPAKPEVVELMPVRVSTARPLQSVPEPNKPVSLREWDQGQASHKKHKLKRRGPKVPAAAAAAGTIQV
jgi:hypothetical protein